MKACISIEDGKVMARYYHAGREWAHIDCGNARNTDKATIEAHIRSQGHEIVEPWDVVEELKNANE